MPASTFAADIDPLYTFLFATSLFFFGLILAILLYSIVRYRRKHADQPAANNTTHNTALEVVWTLIPTVIVMVVFAWGLVGNMDQQVAPKDAIGYTVRAKKWAWGIIHPGDAKQTPAEMWVPEGKPVRVTMTSEDVLHSFYVPAFRQKRDVVPGVRQILWFEVPEGQGFAGQDFHLFCAEYCGDQHSKMAGTVHVVSQEEFANEPWKGGLPDDPVARGEYWYTKAGCLACHSLDGSRRVGPSYQGIWGREGKLVDGSSYKVDADYVKESIRQPQAKIVDGYAGVAMTAYDESALSDDDIADIIEWMKTLK